MKIQSYKEVESWSHQEITLIQLAFRMGKKVKFYLTSQTEPVLEAQVSTCLDLQELSPC